MLVIKTHNVLWTGGWDSTYRVLDLIIDKGEYVQPYYIIDSNRKSTSYELDAMRSIKERLNEQQSELLFETKIYEEEKIAEDPVIKKWHKELSSKAHLGSQYKWLARFAKHENINDLELCVELEGAAVYDFIKNNVIEIEENGDSFYRLVDEPEDDSLRLFQYFIFPTLYMSKSDMEREANQKGFSDLMELTWFCHRPLKDGSPCGVCGPCRYTREEGLQRRVPDPPVSRKVFYLYNSLKRRVKKSLLKS